VLRILGASLNHKEECFKRLCKDLALVVKAIHFGQGGGLVIAAQKENLGRIQDFVTQEEGQHFKAILSTIHWKKEGRQSSVMLAVVPEKSSPQLTVVSHEKKSLARWRACCSKYAPQILELPVDVATNIYRGLWALDTKEKGEESDERQVW